MSQAHPIDHQRFEFLDSLRALAAICVGVTHGADIFHTPWDPANAILAVDFFFCLSGFVLACAYDQRLAQGMTPGDFILRRVIRLYPMIVISIVLGALLLIAKTMVRPEMPMSEALTHIVSTFVLFPSGLMFGLDAYPVNVPLWSIFFEIFINLFYVFFWRSMSNGRGLATLGALAVVLVIAGFSRPDFGVIGHASVLDFALGVFRVGFPFLAGMLIYRLRLHRRLPAFFNRPGAMWLTALLLLGMLANPFFIRNTPYALVCVLFVVPLIVTLGAATGTHSPRLSKWFEWLGGLSFPFYLVHFPVLRVIHEALGHRAPFQQHEVLFLIVGLLATAAVSSVLLSRFDLPVRKWLTAAVHARRAAHAALRTPPARP